MQGLKSILLEGGERPSKDEFLMMLALVCSTRTTCVRKAVGAIAVDAKGHVLSTGYNGVGAGLPHCNAGCPCTGHNLPPGQDSCEAVHAEVNVILQCKNVWAIDTIYCTLEPCERCTKMLLNTACKRLVFTELHTGKTGEALWKKAGRIWEYLQ